MKKDDWFILNGINQKLNAMPVLKFKNSILKRCYLYEWKGNDVSFAEVFLQKYI